MTNKLRILVVEDNPENLAIAMEQFSDSEKYQLTTASDKKEAERLLSSYLYDIKKERKPNPGFDVVLTDLFLPDAEGKEYPFGLVFALLAFTLKVKMVGVVTSYSHGGRDYEFAYSFGHHFGDMCDYGNSPKMIGDSKFYFCDNFSHFSYDPENRNCKKKNWKGVLDILLSSIDSSSETRRAFMRGKEQA